MQQFWTVTLPGLSPVIFFQLIIAIVSSFQIFNQVYVMTDGLVAGGFHSRHGALYLSKGLQVLPNGIRFGFVLGFVYGIMLATWVQFKYSKWYITKANSAK